jgi:hypothetical protein
MILNSFIPLIKGARMNSIMSMFERGISKQLPPKANGAIFGHP